MGNSAAWTQGKARRLWQCRIGPYVVGAAHADGEGWGDREVDGVPQAEIIAFRRYACGVLAVFGQVMLYAGDVRKAP